MWDAPSETVWNTLLHTFRSSRRSKYREEAGPNGSDAKHRGAVLVGHRFLAGRSGVLKRVH